MCVCVGEQICNNEGDKPAPEQPEHLQKFYNDDEIIAMIDPLLAEWDLNRDGYIEYSEFMEHF